MKQVKSTFLAQYLRYRVQHNSFVARSETPKHRYSTESSDLISVPMPRPIATRRRIKVVDGCQIMAHLRSLNPAGSPSRGIEDTLVVPSYLPVSGRIKVVNGCQIMAPLAVIEPLSQVGFRSRGTESVLTLAPFSLTYPSRGSRRPDLTHENRI